jgi:hypothetical protein
LKIVEDGEAGIGLDGVVGFNPGESFLPGSYLAHGFVFVVDEAAGLEVVVGEDLVNFFGLIAAEETLVIALEEIKGERLGHSLSENVTSEEIATRCNLEQCEN